MEHEPNSPAYDPQDTINTLEQENARLKMVVEDLKKEVDKLLFEKDSLQELFGELIAEKYQLEKMLAGCRGPVEYLLSQLPLHPHDEESQ